MSIDLDPNFPLGLRTVRSKTSSTVVIMRAVVVSIASRLCLLRRGAFRRASSVGRRSQAFHDLVNDEHQKEAGNENESNGLVVGQIDRGVVVYGSYIQHYRCR